MQTLHENGHRVIALYRKLNERASRIPWDAIQGDLLESATLRKLSSIDFDLVVHCAATIPSKFFGTEAQQAANTNLLMDGNVVRLCAEKGRHLVYVSGTSVYGPGTGSAITEEAIVSPIGPYVAAKAESERHILGQLPEQSTILRVSSPYGPGQRSMNVIRRFIEQALAGVDLVYLGTGNRQQDCISANDVGNAILSVVGNADAVGIFNIASGTPVSMRALAELVVRTITGTRSRVLASQQPDPQDDYRPRFDIGKALKVLRWRPQVRLDDGIRTYAEYLKTTKAM